MTSQFNPSTVRAFLLLSASLFAGAALAAPRYLPAQAGDLVPGQIMATDAMHASSGAPGLAREALSMSWAAGGDIVTAPPSFTAQSREYYTEVSADQLAAGVNIYTTSPRALVRIQPLNGDNGPREKLAIHPQSLVISSAAGRAYASGSGMEMLVSADKLAKADTPFAEGTSAFRLHPDLGAGAFKLRAADVHGATRYLVNVVEPDSKLALTMKTDAPSYLHGQQLVVSPELQEQDGARVLQRHGMARLDGFVTSPSGRTFPVSFKPEKDGRLRARLALDADETPHPGLWEVSASGSAMVKGQQVMRSVRVAFGVAMPVARFDGKAALLNQPGSFGVRLGVEVGAPGRYETRALLYGMVAGAMKPLAVAHSAHWLEPGSQSLTLNYSAEFLAGASGPYELRDLSLLDQGRVGVLQRQQRALALDDGDIVKTGAHVAAARPVERAKLPPVNN